MGKHVMQPVEEVDIASVKYQHEPIAAPSLSGFSLKLFVWLVESPICGNVILSYLKQQNGVVELLQKTVIPEKPMYKPEFPPQAPETRVHMIEEDTPPGARTEIAVKCLPTYDPARHFDDPSGSFLYWTIRDYAHAYRSGLTTPSAVAERVLLAIDEWTKGYPCFHWLVSFDKEDIVKQAAASTKRFEEGKPLSILDGIFMPIKDDIDCLPYPTTGATSWFHKVRPVTEDAVTVARLRSCGVIFIGKANMHELGLGTSGNNPIHGTPQNPHSKGRYTGGSSSGPAAIVASGLCPASIGTDAGGSVRIPSSLCGVVGLKSTYGRTDMTGSLCDVGTVEVIGPIAGTVEDALLVYMAIVGSSPDDIISLKPPFPCVPNLSLDERLESLRSLRIGKYTEWFNDVASSKISATCDDALNRLCDTYGCTITEIVLPELNEMRMAHVVSVGSESASSLVPEYKDGKFPQLTYDSRTNLALFQSFSAADYVAAQRLRRRIMYYHMEAFKKVDVIVTPTTGMTAPIVRPGSLKSGETDLEMTGYLMRFIIAGNLLGLPAISVPVGHDKEGLPIGLQLIGRPWEEATILRMAFAIEEICLPSRTRPSTFYDILKGI